MNLNLKLLKYGFLIPNISSMKLGHEVCERQISTSADGADRTEQADEWQLPAIKWPVL